MNIVIDTCSLINMMNGQVLSEILTLTSCKFYIGNLVYDEVSQVKSQKETIDNSINLGNLILISNDVPLSQFLSLKRKYQLGDGETESIGHCLNHGYQLSSDDFKARTSGGKELIQANVIGSLYLLREAVRQKIVACNDAMSAYTIMKIKGGFLPEIDESYLCK